MAHTDDVPRCDRCSMETWPGGLTTCKCGAKWCPRCTLLVGESHGCPGASLGIAREVGEAAILFGFFALAVFSWWVATGPTHVPIK